MKLTTAEAIAILSNHLGVKVEIVDQQMSCLHADDGWIINTKTTDGHPPELKSYDFIEVVYAGGHTERAIAKGWLSCWDVSQPVHIVKYRKVD